MKGKYKYNSPLCDNSMTFNDCELAILRHAVDKTEEQKKEVINNPEIIKILAIVEDFIRSKRVLLYGGTAINNILPENAQFYNRDIELPDYDMYSENALDDAKELADIFLQKGYIDIEAKSGIHFGTYKVFVNFIPVADITQLNPQIFKSIYKESIIIDGMHYTPANYLRMSMFLELSRPAGDVSRWEKIYKRLILLNKYYPLETGMNCKNVEFQRGMESNLENEERLYSIVRNAFIDQGVIFFGGYATSLYSRYMRKSEHELVSKIPDFDVISLDPKKTVTVLKERLKAEGFSNVKIKKHSAIGEIIPEHTELRIGNEVMAFIYKPIACHSYNKIIIEGKEILVATIDTILSFYLAFIYINKKYYNKDRLLCMAKFLFDVEQRNRLEQKGLLKRFSIDCYGKQLSLEDIRSEKANKFKELVNKRGSREYESWFLKYNPGLKGKSDTKIMEEKIEEHEETEENENNSTTNKTIKKKTKKPRKSIKDITRRVRERISKKTSDFLV